MDLDTVAHFYGFSRRKKCLKENKSSKWTRNTFRAEKKTENFFLFTSIKRMETKTSFVIHRLFLSLSRSLSFSVGFFFLDVILHFVWFKFEKTRQKAIAKGHLKEMHTGVKFKHKELNLVAASYIDESMNSKRQKHH